MPRFNTSQGQIKLKIYHEKDIYAPNEPNYHRTVAMLTDQNGRNWQAEAVCHPSDQFSRHKGVSFAVARAFKQAGDAFPKKVRQEIWSHIWNGKFDGADAPTSGTNSISDFEVRDEALSAPVVQEGGNAAMKTASLILIVFIGIVTISAIAPYLQSLINQ